MTKEKEIWGLISKKEFDNKIKLACDKYGTPEVHIRLSIEINDWKDTEVDTRIRITDGEPVLMQKTGAWDSNEKIEISIKIDNEARKIVDLIKILKNIIQKGDPRIYFYQFYNYIFKTDEFELKFTRQYGKTEKYSFEIEVLIEGANIHKIASSLKLEEYTDTKDTTFWENWNKGVSLDGLKMTDTEMTKLIKKYLK